MAVIYVSPPHDGLPAVMSKTGSLPVSRKHEGPVFHQGQVFTREGTSNALVNHKMWAQVLKNFRNQSRREARHDVDALVQRILQMMGQLPSPAQIIPDLGMDEATFTESVRVAFTQGQSSVLKRFLSTARSAYKSANDEGNRSLALNRIAAVAVEAIQCDELTVVEQVVDDLFSLYESHLTPSHPLDGGPDAPFRWLEIVLRVMVIGSSAVRAQLYAAIPTIALRQVGSGKYVYRSWIRHGQTMAARKGLPVTSEESSRGSNLLALSSGLMHEHPELRPDIPMRDDSEPSEELLDSLRQFDFMWCCASLAAVGDGPESAAFYPSCSAYHQHRVMPAILKLERDSQTRTAVFPDADDSTIADSIVQVVKQAETQSWNYGGWWGGSRELAQTEWIQQHTTKGIQ